MCITSLILSRDIDADTMIATAQGWKMFDHGAHLAAVACGYLFVHGGYDGGVRLQRYVVREWRALRKSI